MRSGHIPGSASLPYTDLLRPDGTFEPAAALRARFATAGVDGARLPVTSCGSSVTACILTLGLRLTRLPRRGVETVLDDGAGVGYSGGDELNDRQSRN